MVTNSSLRYIPENEPTLRWFPPPSESASRCTELPLPLDYHTRLQIPLKEASQFITLKLRCTDHSYHQSQLPHYHHHSPSTPGLPIQLASWSPGLPPTQHARTRWLSLVFQSAVQTCFRFLWPWRCCPCWSACRGRGCGFAVRSVRIRGVHCGGYDSSHTVQMVCEV